MEIVEPNIEYQSFKLMAELPLTRKIFLVYSREIEFNQKVVRLKIKDSFFFIPSFFKVFSKFKILHDQVWSRISSDLLKKILQL